MNDERAKEAMAMLRALADRDDVSGSEAEAFDMPESARFHDERRKLLTETANEIERLRAALKPFAEIHRIVNQEGESRDTLWGWYGEIEVAELKLEDLRLAAEVLK